MSAGVHTVFVAIPYMFIKHFNKQNISDGDRIFYSLTINFIV